jgi:cytochrome c553
MTTKFLVDTRNMRGGRLLESMVATALKPFVSAVTLGLATFLCAAQARAGDNGTHPQVNVAMCRGCHGLPGYRTAFPDVYSVPKLGGQQAQYLAKALQDYRSGLRPHATMRSIAATLSDQDIAALAAYYAGNHK